MQICISVAEKLDSGSHTSIKKNLRKLISHHYVEQAPVADLPMPKVSIHPNALVKSSGVSAVAKAALIRAQKDQRLDEVVHIIFLAITGICLELPT